MDSFEEKHKMVQKLLSMLKNHAVNEVDGGLKKPEGEGDMHGIQVEKVEVLPGHEMDHPTPEHDVETKELHEGGMAYNKGGVVDKVNEGGYKSAPEKKIPYESAEGHPDMEGAAHKEVTIPLESREAKATEEEQEPHDSAYEEAESEPSSMFAGFLRRNKKK